MWLFRGRRSPLRRGDTDVERRVRWALLYTWCSWCPGTMKYFLANEMWVFLVMPFLTNQKIIWVIFWLVEIDQSGSRLTNQWGYFVSKYGDVIGSEWGILIGCWNRDSSALSVSCDPVLTRLWSRDCDNSDCLVPKIEFPLFGWILFLVIIKWRVTVIALRFWIKTGLLFLLWHCFGGHTGRAMHRECMSVLLWLFCSSISGGPRVGPNLIAHVSSIYKWCVQWLTWGSRCCCFRGSGLF